MNNNHITQIKLVKPIDLNPSNHLFAAQSASWFVEESYLCAAYQFPQCKLVCRCVKNLEMLLPVNNGDILMYSGNCEFGKTSITVNMTVYRQKDNKVVTKGQVIFVNIDEEGKPIPHNIKN